MFENLTIDLVFMKPTEPVAIRVIANKESNTDYFHTLYMKIIKALSQEILFKKLQICLVEPFVNGQLY